METKVSAVLKYTGTDELNEAQKALPPGVLEMMEMCAVWERTARRLHGDLCSAHARLGLSAPPLRTPQSCFGYDNGRENMIWQVFPPLEEGATWTVSCGDCIGCEYKNRASALVATFGDPCGEVHG